MGVWIETGMSHLPNVSVLSHPVWVCGLKHLVMLLILFGQKVTPCMGVWIETQI